MGGMRSLMPQWLQNLIDGWPMIRANLPTFFLILVVIVGAVWLVFSFSYGQILASKDAQIQLQDRQITDYKEKLQGATPDQAKARIDDLENRLKRVEPRGLTDEQKRAFIQSARVPAGSGYQVSVTHEGRLPRLSGLFGGLWKIAKRCGLADYRWDGYGAESEASHWIGPHGAECHRSDGGSRDFGRRSACRKDRFRIDAGSSITQHAAYAVAYYCSRLLGGFFDGFALATLRSAS
jgi:hypothetical protein